MRLLHLGVVQDRPWSVLVAFLSNTCNISDDQPGTKIKFTQNKKYHIREGFMKKVAVLLDFVQITSTPPLPLIWTNCTTLLNANVPKIQKSSYFFRETFPKYNYTIKNVSIISSGYHISCLEGRQLITAKYFPPCIIMHIILLLCMTHIIWHCRAEALQMDKPENMIFQICIILLLLV